MVGVAEVLVVAAVVAVVLVVVVIVVIVVVDADDCFVRIDFVASVVVVVVPVAAVLPFVVDSGVAVATRLFEPAVSDDDDGISLRFVFFVDGGPD